MEYGREFNCKAGLYIHGAICITFILSCAMLYSNTSMWRYLLPVTLSKENIYLLDSVNAVILPKIVQFVIHQQSVPLRSLGNKKKKRAM